MNYLDYMEIMKSEGLTLPLVAEHTLDNAKKCQTIIRSLQKEKEIDTSERIKDLEEQKIFWILEAIDWARLAKELPDEFKWADKKMKDMERKTNR